MFETLTFIFIATILALCFTLGKALKRNDLYDTLFTAHKAHMQTLEEILALRDGTLNTLQETIVIQEDSIRLLNETIQELKKQIALLREYAELYPKS